MSLELEQQTLQEQFETIIKTEDKLQIREFLDDQNISDVAELVYEFPEYDSQIIAGMSVNRAASVFKILDLPTQKTIIRELPPNTTASLLNELPADDRTDFLEELPSNVVRELIKLLDPNERKVTLSLLGYPENSIGRLMTPDYVYIYPWNTIEEVFSTIRKYGKDSETINVIYVINEKGELLDDIRIRDFILNPPDKKVADMMDDRFIALHPEDDQELAIALLACARIGTIHSVVFGGFSAQAIADRLQDAHAEFVITCDGAYRGAKDIPLKSVIDDALVGCSFVKRVIVCTRTRTPLSMIKGRDCGGGSGGVAVLWFGGADRKGRHLLASLAKRADVTTRRRSTGGQE